jgi:hypothetical protein
MERILGKLGCWSSFLLVSSSDVLYLMNFDEILLLDVHIKLRRAELLVLVRIGPVYPSCIKVNRASVEIRKTACN